jgi:hypothetical protein
LSPPALPPLKPPDTKLLPDEVVTPFPPPPKPPEKVLTFVFKATATTQVLARKPPDLYLNLEDKVQVNPAAMIEEEFRLNNLEI